MTSFIETPLGRLILLVGRFGLDVYPLDQTKLDDQRRQGKPIDGRGLVSSPSHWFREIGLGVVVVDVYNTEVASLKRWRA